MSDTYSVISFLAKKLPQQYEALIYDRWLKSYSDGNHDMRRVPKKLFLRKWRKRLEFILAQPEARVRLAVLSDDHDIVLGFVIYRGETIDYIHVLHDQREQGIARILLPPNIAYFSHITKMCENILKKNPKYKAWKYNPFD